MAKGKKKSGKTNRKFSESEYIKERARSLERGKCYANANWKEAGMAAVIVTRLHKQGGVTAGFYLLDTLCLGLKDTYYAFNTTETEIKEYIAAFGQDGDMEEISYDEAHNIIYAAIEFAAEGGIKPAKGWSTTRYILDEDDDNVPLIDYEMGRDGKHVLMVESNRELETYLPTLRKNLGDNVEYHVCNEGDNEQMAEIASKTSNGGELIEEAYTHKTTIGTNELRLHNETLKPLMKAKKTMPRAIKSILDMPHGELKDDLEQILLYSMGSSCRDETPDGDPMIFNAVRFLGEVGDGHSLDILLETLRQDHEYLFHNFYGEPTICYVPTLTKLAHDHTDRLEDLMREAGISPLGQNVAMATLTQIYYTHPEKQPAITKTWHRMIDFYTEAALTRRGYDSFAAAFAVGALIDLRDKGMLPQIRRLMETTPVSTFVCGDYEKVAKCMDDEEYEYSPDKYPADINRFYKMAKKELWNDD